MSHTQSEYKYLAATVRKVGFAGRDNQNRSQAGQGTWKCGLPAEVVNEDQTTLQEMMSLKRTPHTTLDGNHHNRQV